MRMRLELIPLPVSDVGYRDRLHPPGFGGARTAAGGAPDFPPAVRSTTRKHARELASAVTALTCLRRRNP